MANIVIIDSGVKQSHPCFKNKQFEGVHFFKNEDGVICYDNDIEDKVGHGTAVTGILTKHNVNDKFIIVRIFEDDFQTDEDILIAALDYVFNNICCHIINLSLGLTQYTSVETLHNLCQSLQDKGVIIVSAFDNFGMISFPAAFNEVIGVDSSESIKSLKSYNYVENSPVTIVMRKGAQRVNWIKPDYIIAKGNSFVAPYVTSMVASAVNNGFTDSKNIFDYLKKNAANIIGSEHNFSVKPQHFIPVKKAVIFPFNKEVHSLVRYNKSLSFEISLYDRKEKGLIGSSTSSKIPGTNYIIEDINKLDWQSDFDTVILSHCGELSLMIGNDIVEGILEHCIRYRKNLFAFDDLHKYNDKILSLNKVNCKTYYPQFDKSDVPQNMFDKLYYVPVPVLTICGTSSSQGKFTLQQALRLRMEKNGIRVGQVGTEPSAMLYGHDNVCPIGYEGNVRISGYEFISAVNYMLFKTAEKGNDIIITGTQSSTIPYNYDTLRNIPLYTLEYLMASRPDGVVLCVNAYDEIEYIERTIRAIEGLVDTRIIALALYPLTIDIGWGEAVGAKRCISSKEKDNFIKNAQKHFDKPTVCVDSEEGYDEIFKYVLEYFLNPNK